MNIVCLDCPFAPAFSQAGHQVLCLDKLTGVQDIAELLAQQAFKPDLLLQFETLGRRVLLRNLEQLACVRVFCAVDSHLNIHWHKFYTRLFDLTLTPHMSFYEQMPPEWTPKQLGHWAMPGRALPFTPHAERSHPLSFVGLAEAAGRPLRLRFLNLLTPLGLHNPSAVYGNNLFKLYADTRLVPNEAIAFEVNFRLTEAASAGCCVLTPDVGEDQNRLFEPDQEIMLYEHGLDLLEKAAFLLHHPKLAEKLGQAALRRVWAEHLPEHRVREILAQCEEATGQPPDPLASNPALDLALLERGRHLGSQAPAKLLERLLKSGNNEAKAVAFRALVETRPDQDHSELARHWLAKLDKLGKPEPELLPAILAFALQRNDLELFKLVWLKQSGQQPKSLYQAALLLADYLSDLRRYFMPGFSFRPESMLPETALEALQTAARFSNGDQEWARRLERLCSRSKGLTLFRQQALAKLVGVRASWQDFLAFGLTSLQAYDLTQASAALRQATVLAGQNGQEEALAGIMREHKLEPTKYR